MSKSKKRLYDIVKSPDAILNKGDYEKITDFGSDWLITTVTDMVHTTKTVRGVGLAAPQIGLPLQLAVCIIDKQPVALINPEIVAHADEQVSIEEACLSCPGVAVRIPRYYWVEVAYDTIKGKQTKGRFEGTNAIIVQHEIDHLRGKLIVDFKV